MMLNELLKNTEAAMQRALDSYQVELSKLRTGRAHIGLVDNVRVDYYGNETAIKNVASIVVSDARTLTITPWEKIMVKPIEKAIQNADLGLNPISDANLVRVPVPALNEERRKDMVKILKGISESSRVATRNLRREAMDHLKALLKQKEIDEDMERRTQDAVQKLTDGFISEIDKLALIKEEELLKV